MTKTTVAARPKPRPAIQRMAPYVPPTGGRHGKLRLDFNENTVGCSPRVAALLARISEPDFLAAYPEYNQARPKIAAWLGLEPEQLLLTNGTDEAIHCLINTYIDPGDEVLIPWPAYSMYQFYTELAGALPHRVLYRAPDLVFPLDELLGAINDNTRAILLANPNNPTGGAIRLAAIEKILSRAGDAAVLIDEAYFEFYNVTALDLLDAYPNLFVSRTFSKTYGMAGFRVGCLLSQAENIALAAKGQSPYSVNSLAAACAMEAIEDQKFIKNYVAEALDARRLLREGLDKLGIAHHRSEANFVLAQFGDSLSDVCAGLREKGILIRDRGHEIPGAARITAGTREQAATLLTALEEVLAKVRE
ncbi:MAG TPA: histidinol-phosphate transaminase [Bryobacterales bacterium]|nr:histidinol-phosphate transaminase [Bryobacterales bacterium]